MSRFLKRTGFAGPGRRRNPSAAVSVLLLGAGGCALYQNGDRELTSYLEQRVAVRDASAGAYAYVPPPTRERPSPTPPSGKPQTLDRLRDYLVTALERNPDIKAAEDTMRSKLERVRQVTALPDPFLRTKSLPEPVRTAEGDNFFILGVTQKLPAPEKLDRAGRAALSETRMAMQQLEATRLRVIADVKRAYFMVYIVDRSMEVTQANQNLLQGLIDVARTQVAAGRRSQDDVLRAQVELSDLEAELIALRQRRVTFAARLNDLLDRDPQTEVPTPEDFGIREIDSALDALLDKATRFNPELQRLKHKIDRDRETLKLAELAYWPDFSIGFEWIFMRPRRAFRPLPNAKNGLRLPFNRQSEQGSDNWAITFGFTLPIWFDKIHGGIEEAGRRLAASRRQYESAINRIEFSVEDALARVRAQQQLARLFKGTIIPQAEQTYRVSQASYSAGTSDFLDVIDNWRKWLVFTIEYYRSLGELERSVADLEQVIGLSLPAAGGP